MAAADLSCLECHQHEPVADLVNSIENTFIDLEACFANLDRPAPPSIRAQHAAVLADQSIHLVAALKTAHPELFRRFMKTWHAN
ncbi:hypothetical protein E1193_07680 [Micromonospora sp. KC606]|uniref:hypothetical protein n=1 Tax=Micromonospora sp. KC606 TaxID=2530379 RepID=UPI0010510B2B|nr:hypothetical protein [Micromonospora sp. KC606]TDC83797.1 hypothetical protein E1193_07680 [Micromonospora sp. KC606]